MKKQAVLVPGAVLKETLGEYQISVAKLSEDIGLSASAIRQITNSKLKISLEIGLKLAVYFGSPSRYWIDLQNEYSLAELEKDAEFTAVLKNIPKAKKAAPKAAPKTAPKAAGRPGRQAADKKADVKKTGGRPAKAPGEKKPRAPRKSAE
jgi:addiction module HigA family antidote